MKEHPIIFSDAMVNAILEGRKTQTRRILKVAPPQEGDWKPDRYNKGKHWAFWEQKNGGWTGRCSIPLFLCPYGDVGDLLWVKETFRYNPLGELQYRADFTQDDLNWLKSHSIKLHCKSPRFMHRSSSRITLELTGVRLERVQDITEADAQAEGVTLNYPVGNVASAQAAPYVYGYAQLWDKINGAGSWESNPWVWVLEFKRVKP